MILLSENIKLFMAKNLLKLLHISIKEHSRWPLVNFYVCFLDCWTKRNFTLWKRVGNQYNTSNLCSIFFFYSTHRSIKVTIFSRNLFQIPLDISPNCFLKASINSHRLRNSLVHQKTVDWRSNKSSSVEFVPRFIKRVNR